jgi:hypothetical protein
MKYLKRIYENFSSESDFEDYLRNHFEDVLDDNWVHYIRLETRRESSSLPTDNTFHTRMIFYYSTFVSPNRGEEAFNMKKVNDYLSKMSNLFSKINEIIENIENDPNLLVTYILHEEERVVISIRES